MSLPYLILYVDIGSGIDTEANMTDYEGEEMDHAADDNEMEEVDDIMYFRGRVIGDSESDEEDEDDYDHMVRYSHRRNSFSYHLIPVEYID